jgi:N4-gp56 family major capsid protein
MALLTFGSGGVGGGAGSQSNQFVVYNKMGFLTILRAELVFEPWCKNGSLPTGMGSDTARWFRYADLAADTTELIEGQNPTEDVITNPTQIDVRIKQFGSFIKVSDKLDLMKISGTQEQFRDILARKAALSLDTMIQTEALTTSTIIRAGGQANSSLDGPAAGSVITAGLRDIARIRGKFRSLNAKPHSATPGGRFFGLIVDPEVSFDIMSDAAAVGGQANVFWLDISKYIDKGSILEGSPGSVMGVAFKETTQIDTVTDTGQVVFRNLVFADEGLGCLKLSGKSGIEIINKKSGPNDTSNALNMFQTYGYKFWTAYKLLDSNRLARFLSLS